VENEPAIAAVKRLGGVVKRDDSLPGRPVVEVNLTFYGALGGGDLRPLASFRRLRTLKVLVHRLTPALVAELQSFTGVKSLALHVSDCSGLDPRVLTRLDSLEELGLRGNAVTDDVLKRVVGLASDAAAPGAAGGRGPGAMRREASLAHLKSLYLRDTLVTDTGLKQLAVVRGLERLGLCHNEHLTEAGLRQVARLKRLKGLSLEQRGGVTDATLTELTSLAALEDLGLYETSLTDAGMKEVVRFKHLSEFSLSASDVTESGLMELVALKQLKRVSVFPSARMTEEGVGRLKQALGGRAEVVSIRAVISQVPCD
jgi:hypothetical protein